MYWKTTLAIKEVKEADDQINPTAQQFGYNDLTIAAQRDIAPVIRGNVGGRYEKKKCYQVSDEPVHKRKKPKPSNE